MVRSLLEPFYLQKKGYSYSLDSILTHIYQHVPYYKRYKGCKLEELPIMTKGLLHDHFSELIADNVVKKNTYINTSGGSTGEPVRILQDQQFKIHTRWVTYQQKSWTGYQFGERMIKLWGNEQEIYGKHPLKQNLINWLKNVTVLNSFRMGHDDMKRYLTKINRFRPRLIVAYAQAIYELAKYAQEQQITVHPIPAIMSSAGMLYPFMKETIETVFQTKVYNRYGCREAGPIASTGIEIDAFKIATNNVFLEIVDDQGKPVADGEEGDILVTLLSNYSMPLIRYNIGDRGILNRTEYSYPVLEKVTGRATDGLRTKEGCFISTIYFLHMIGVVFNKKNSWIKKFQIIQEDYDQIIVKVVPKRKHHQEDLDQITESIQKVMGEESHVDFEFLDQIPSLKNGKYRYTISKIDAP